MGLFSMAACLLGVAAVCIIFIAVIVIIAYRRPKSEADLAATVKDLMPNVHPWQPEALANLRTHYRTNWARIGRGITMRGLITAARSRNERAWAAFAMRGRILYRPPFFFHGQALVRTTERTFELNAQSNGVTVRVDGRLLGVLRPDGVLLDADGQPVGHFQLEGEQEEPIFPLTLHGRVVARLARPYQSYGLGILGRPKQPPPPAVEIATPSMEPYEADWLLALVLWQIVNRAARHTRLRTA